MDMRAYNLSKRKAAKAKAKEFKTHAAMDALDFQERIAPTELSELREVVLTADGPKQRSAGMVRRRKADACTWGAFDLAQERAAEHIVYGHVITGGTIGVRTAKYGEQVSRGTGGQADCSAAQIAAGRTYLAWVEKCKRERLDVADVLAVLFGEESLYGQDKRRKQGHGKARTHLFAALSLYDACRPKRPAHLRAVAA